jgi:hypothetical protein
MQTLSVNTLKPSKFRYAEKNQINFFDFTSFYPSAARSLLTIKLTQNLIVFLFLKELIF